MTNVKLALADGKFTYEPSYNLVKKAPSLAVSRPIGSNGGKYKVGGCTSVLVEQDGAWVMGREAE